MTTGYSLPNLFLCSESTTLPAIQVSKPEIKNEGEPKSQTVIITDSYVCRPTKDQYQMGVVLPDAKGQPVVYAVKVHFLSVEEFRQLKLQTGSLHR